MDCVALAEEAGSVKAVNLVLLGRLSHYFDFPDAFARELAGELIRANPELVVITDEIGCGIVPMDAGERIYRECAGRVCTELAAFSGKVYRVSCGIGVLIKG